MAGRGDFAPTGFGGRLREVREGKGLTQKELADRAGSHTNTIARLERGEQEPAWPLVLALAAALEVDCTAFGGSGSAAKKPARPAARKPARRK